MTLAIQHRDDEIGPVADYQTTAVARLAEWARSAQAAHEVATSLVKTSFVPEAFRDKAHEATAAILAGLELDFSPMASLRAFDIIQGTAAPRAIALRAVVQSKGHDIWVEESTATRAIVKGRRRGEDRVQTSTWTIDRAQKMSLTGKHNWKVQPQAMLLARATSECARLVASDAILGIPYSSEELADGADVDLPMGEPAAAPTTTASRPRTARRRPLEPVPTPEPDFDEPAVVAEPVSGPPATDTAAPMVTEAQQRKMHALFRDVEVTDRAQRLQYVSEVLGREVGSSKELTRDEAGQVIDALERWVANSQPTAEEVADVVGDVR